MKLGMKEARRQDYSDYQEATILKYSRTQYLCVILGLCISVVFPILYTIWVLLSSRPIGDAVKIYFYALPMGFICFAYSFRCKASCLQCDGDIEIFWCQESDEQGRRSGPLAVCESCRTFEARLSSDDAN